MRNIDYLHSNSIIASNSSLNQLGTSPDTPLFVPNSHVNGMSSSPSSVLSSAAHKRKLILHFDQHNTIQVACTLPGRHITVEEGLNTFLTTVAWGKEIEEERWEWVSREPRLTKPPDAPDAITYFKYLEKKLVKSPDDRARLKQVTCRFIHEEPGRDFKEFFDLYLESLIYQRHESDEEEEDHKLYYYINGSGLKAMTNGGGTTKCNGNGHSVKIPPNTIPAGDPSNKSLYHLILPEFFDMIRRLQKASRDFSIILRTMGIDSHNFLETIRPIFEGKHRDFRDLKPIKINSNVGQIKRSADGTIQLHMDGQVYSNDAEIYAKLCSLEGISAIRDDFAYWQASDYSCYAAKPLWIDLNDLDHHHIIFDDNIRLDSTIDDCIVNIRLRRLGSPPEQFESIDFESYELFEKSSILQPNLIKLLNPHMRSDSTRNYYYDLVRKSEAVYDRLLAERDKLDIHSAFQEKNTSEDALSTTSTTGGDENETVMAQADDLNQDQLRDANMTRRKSEDLRLLEHFKEKRLRNLKLNRSFSMRLEEAEKQAEKENIKSTLCVVS